VTEKSGTVAAVIAWGFQAAKTDAAAMSTKRGEMFFMTKSEGVPGRTRRDLEQSAIVREKLMVKQLLLCSRATPSRQKKSG
jgi:hypothetical protein